MHQEILYIKLNKDVEVTAADVFLKDLGSLYCKDESMEYFDIIRVKNPFQVREIIADLVEQQREEKGFRIKTFFHRVFLIMRGCTVNARIAPDPVFIFL